MDNHDKLQVMVAISMIPILTAIAIITGFPLGKHVVEVIRRYWGW